MESLMQDIRYGWRMLGKNPGFTTIAVLTLAIGIGASTATFSVVDTVLLQSLPYQQPERLVTVTETLPGMSADEVGVAAGEYEDYRDRNHSFSQVAAYQSTGFNLTGAGSRSGLTRQVSQHRCFHSSGYRRSWDVPSQRTKIGTGRAMWSCFLTRCGSANMATIRTFWARA